jgi:hypothetical protein
MKNQVTNPEEQKMVTIYTTTEFGMGIAKWTGKLVDFGRMKYAQYDSAPFFTFVPKRKRSAFRFVKASHTYVLILEGVNHPEPADFYGEAKKSEDGLVTIKESRYTAFDDRYKNEFDSKIENYIKSQNVIMDIRDTVNTNIINKYKL